MCLLVVVEGIVRHFQHLIDMSHPIVASEILLVGSWCKKTGCRKQSLRNTGVDPTSERSLTNANLPHHPMYELFPPGLEREMGGNKSVVYN